MKSAWRLAIGGTDIIGLVEKLDGAETKSIYFLRDGRAESNWRLAWPRHERVI